MHGTELPGRHVDNSWKVHCLYFFSHILQPDLGGSALVFAAGQTFYCSTATPHLARMMGLVPFVVSTRLQVLLSFLH